MFLKRVHRPVVSVPWYERNPIKNRATPSIEGMVRYRVSGRGVHRETWIYFHPDQLSEKLTKYESLGQRLYGPLPIE